MKGFIFRFPENAVAMSFQRLAERFFEFFVPDCGNYKHFSVSGQTVGICLFGIFAGVLIAMLVTAYEKSLHADFIGSVIDLGATDAEHAVTLAELGFLKNRRVRREFRDGVGLSKYVRCVEEEAWGAIEWVPVSTSGNASDLSVTAEPAGEESGAEILPDGSVSAGKPDMKNGGNPGAEQKNSPRYLFDFEAAHFYLPEENRLAAEVRYMSQKKHVGGLILSVFALVALYILMIFVTPELLQLLDNCLGLLAG